MQLDASSSLIAREYSSLERLYSQQPLITQRFIDQQAVSLYNSFEKRAGLLIYKLPNQIILEGGDLVEISDPDRKHSLGLLRKAGNNRDRLGRSLDKLENRLNPALAACARLLRFAIAQHILLHLLPDGSTVNYILDAGDDIPSIPSGIKPSAALIAASDTVMDGHSPDPDQNQVPFVEAARSFFIPQWVAFGQGDTLLTRSVEEAVACIASLRKAVDLLDCAVEICPSLVANPAYQRKRVGLLGQLVNQGRALARFQVKEIISRISRRVSSGSLNRGFSLSLPYFNDKTLSMDVFEINVIPHGRIVFVPAFIGLAMQRAEKKIVSDYRLTQSTRNHILIQLRTIKNAFKSGTRSEI